MNNHPNFHKLQCMIGACTASEFFEILEEKKEKKSRIALERNLTFIISGYLNERYQYGVTIKSGKHLSIVIQNQEFESGEIKIPRPEIEEIKKDLETILTYAELDTIVDFTVLNESEMIYKRLTESEEKQKIAKKKIEENINNFS